MFGALFRTRSRILVTHIVRRITPIRYAHSKIEVVVTDNFPGIGVKGEIKRVARGYARNYLVPRGLAVYATEENKLKFKPWTDKIDVEAQAKEQELRKAQRRLRKVVVQFRRKVLSSGALHGPVVADNIVEKLFKQHQIQLEPSQVLLEKPITALGTFAVPVKLEGQIVNLSINVQKW